MLGRGRPFVVELENPKSLVVSEQTLIDIEKEIVQNSGGDVAVRDLQLGPKDEVAFNLKEGEADKRKRYSALCICSRPLTDDDLQRIASIQDLRIDQKTPIRVLHRFGLSTCSDAFRPIQMRTEN
jgi:tRNA pseudouridine synthase 10